MYSEENGTRLHFEKCLRIKNGIVFQAWDAVVFSVHGMMVMENSMHTGRFNVGVVTLNLAYIALEAHEDMNKFWELLDKYADLCFKAHMTFCETFRQNKASVAPILWQHSICKIKS